MVTGGDHLGTTRYAASAWALHTRRSRAVAEARVVARATGDSSARMEAWDETEPIAADLSIDTGGITAEVAAGLVHDAVIRR